MSNPISKYALHGYEKGFRWRSREISRIEAFSDAVFAFAVTLLVISLEVPKTFSELQHSLGGFVAFFMAFLLLFVVWTMQNRFFRRYGLEDALTLWLNAILLFVVLFFVYPLKFLFTWLVMGLTGQSTEIHLPNGTIEHMVEGAQSIDLMMLYSGGYMAVFAVFFAMYFHAWRLRIALELDPKERWATRVTLQEIALNIAIGLVAFCIAGYRHDPGLSGLIYVLVGPSMALHGAIMGKLWRRHA